MHTQKVRSTELLLRLIAQIVEMPDQFVLVWDFPTSSAKVLALRER